MVSVKAHKKNSTMTIKRGNPGTAFTQDLKTICGLKIHIKMSNSIQLWEIKLEFGPRLYNSSRLPLCLRRASVWPDGERGLSVRVRRSSLPSSLPPWSTSSLAGRGRIAEPQDFIAQLFLHLIHAQTR